MTDLAHIKAKLQIVANDAPYISSYEYRDFLRWAVDEIEHWQQTADDLRAELARVRAQPTIQVYPADFVTQNDHIP